MKHKYLKNVTTLRLLSIGEPLAGGAGGEPLTAGSRKCTGCGKCTEVCPHGVFTIENGKAVITDKDSCMECGACAKNCPVSAIDVDAGVGCALAVIMGWLTGKEPTCGCASGECC